MSGTVTADELKLAELASAGAASASARYDFAAAAELYTRALDALGRVDGDSPAEVLCQAVDVLLGRAVCYDRLARSEAQIDDLLAAEHLAEAAGDRLRRVRALTARQRALAEFGEYREAMALVPQAIRLARAAGDQRLLV